ncbi:MAG: ABC transporter permease [Bacteroidota bacterium]
MLQFFRWFCHPDYAEDIEGDLVEKYHRHIRQAGLRKANWKFMWAIFSLFRPSLMKNFADSLPQNLSIMFQHNFKISFRTLWRDGGFSLINIGGLAFGMAVAICIGLWIHDELSFNQYHKNYDTIAQVKRQQNWRGNAKRITSDYQVTALGTLLKDNYRHYFEQVVMMRQLEEWVLATDNQSFTQKGHFMQWEGAKMFSLNMIQGNQEGLKEQNSIFLSQTLAKKLFDTENPINQVIKLAGKVDLKVTGVYEDLPNNSSFHGATFFSPLPLYFALTGGDANAWSNSNMRIYTQIKKTTDFTTTTAAIKDELANHLTDDEVKSTKPTILLQPMKNWHLYNEFENGKMVTSQRLQFVWFYSIIGLFVLFLACINFMNLSTARSEKRAKEIGVRKTMGSQRGHLISQFLSESFIVALLAYGIALLMVKVSLPWFNVIAGKDIQLLWEAPMFWFLGLSFTLFTGFLAGSYPALYLSGFQPVNALKGTARGAYAVFPRKVLVVFQFTVSIALMIGTLVVFQQIQHTKNRPVGYEQDGLLMMPKATNEIYKKVNILHEELKKSGAVISTAQGNYPLTNEFGQNQGFGWQGKEVNMEITFNTIQISEDYGKTVGWKILAGRDFSKDFSTDNAGVIITEAARRAMGLDQPIGAQLEYKYGHNGIYDFTIIGVVDDLIKANPYEAPLPAIMFLGEKGFGWQFFRLNPQLSTREAIVKMEAVFKEVVPATPLDYQFIDAAYQRKFESEERIGQLAAVFATLAVLISCLGLFGLAAYMAEKRTKEIGIRKILGASILNLWQLLSQEFIMLVFIAGLLASLIAYFFAQSWLSNFNYRIAIPWTIFGLVGLGALIITLVTVSFQALRAALMNPVEIIKNN